MHDQLSGSSSHSSSILKGFLLPIYFADTFGDWHEALDKRACVAVILMDLSTAFDCLPP